MCAGMEGQVWGFEILQHSCHPACWQPACDGPSLGYQGRLGLDGNMMPDPCSQGLAGAQQLTRLQGGGSAGSVCQSCRLCCRSNSVAAQSNGIVVFN